MNITPAEEVASASGDPDGDAPVVGATSTDGRSARWEDHRQARRDELVSAVRKAVHRNGSGVSMDDIAQQTGVAKPVLYRYFGDKAGLQRAVGERVIARMEAALAAAARSANSPRERLLAMVTVYLEMAESSPNVYAFVTTAPVVSGGATGAEGSAGGTSSSLNHFFDAVTEMVAQPFAEQLSAVPARAWIADQWAAAAIGFVRGSGEWWIEHRGRKNAPRRRQLAEQITAWLWSGVTGPAFLAGDPPAATANARL